MFNVFNISMLSIGALLLALILFVLMFFYLKMYFALKTKINKEFEEFNFLSLEHKFQLIKNSQLYKDTNISNSKVSLENFEEEISNLKNIYDKSLIDKKVLILKKSKLITYLFNKKNIYLYLSFFHKYKIDFLKLKFKLNEINLENEIINFVIDSAKSIYKETNILINSDTNLTKIYLKKFKNEGDEINNLFQNIYSSLERSTLYEINEKLRNCLNVLESFYKNISFYKKVFILIKNLNFKLKELIKQIEKKSNILASLTIVLNKEILNIESIKNEIADSLYKSYSDSILINLKIFLNKILNLEQIVFLEQKKLDFINQNNSNLKHLIDSFYTLTNFLEKNEIIWNSNFDNKRKDSLNLLKKLTKTSLDEYLSYEQESFLTKTPSIFLQKVIDFAGLYKIFLDKIYEHSQQAFKWIDQKNKINELISLINKNLLNIEFILSNLPKKISNKYDNKILNFQKVENEFIIKYKPILNLNEISKDEWDLVKSYYKKSQIFLNEVYVLIYLYMYIENMIIKLNKFRSKNIETSNLIEELEKSFKTFDYSFSLRLGIKICELNNIYE